MSEQLTVDDVRQAVWTIAQGEDDEVQHMAEDALHQRVLRAIANGTCNDPAASAHEALKTLTYDFCRWFA